MLAGGSRGVHNVIRPRILPSSPDIEDLSIHMGGLSLSRGQGLDDARFDGDGDDAIGDPFVLGSMMLVGRGLPRPWGRSPMDEFREGHCYLTVTELTSPSWLVAFPSSVSCPNIC